MAILHDAYRIISSQNVTMAATPTSNVSVPFGPETFWIMVTVAGLYAVGSGARIVIGDNPTFSILSGTYNSTTGLVTLQLSSPHGLSPGATGVVVSGATGTGANLSSVNGTVTAGAGTTGATLTYTIATTLTITTITGGKVVTGTNPTATTTSALIPVNFPVYFAVSPGQTLACTSNDSTAGTLNVTELA